jgi:hypothetical protein
MEIIEIKTLVDITRSGARRANQGTQKEVDQYKNWTTLNQCIEIRSIIAYDNPPLVEVVDVKGMGFGSEYKGKQKVWTWTFRPDQQQAFKSSSDALGLLVEDLDGVPFIKKLDETVNIEQAVFNLKDSDKKNTLLNLITGNT